MSIKEHMIRKQRITKSKNEDPTPALDSPRPIDEPHENKNDCMVKELLFLEEEPPDLKNWSCEDVYYYFKKHLKQKAAQALLRKNIDGNALKLMGRREVFNLGLRVGPSLKIWFHVQRLQLRSNNLMETCHTKNEDPTPASDSPRPIDEPHENKNDCMVKELLFLEEEPPDLKNWSCEDVYYYFKKHLKQKAAQALLRKNIDGNALKLMGRREVFNLGLKVGPSLKIWFHVQRLQLRSNNLMETCHTTNEDPTPASDSPRPIDKPHENENDGRVKELLFLEEEPPDSKNWSCEDVYNHFKKHLTEEAAQALLKKNIDGNALKLMGRREVLNLGFELGLSLKIFFHVRRLQLRTNNLMDIWNTNATNEDPTPASDSPRPIDEPHENENDGRVKELLFLEEEPPDSKNWSCEDVYDYFKKHLTEEAAQALLRKNIDGNALKLMGRREVLNLGFELGLSLKIFFHVRRLQLRTNNLMDIWNTNATNEDPTPASDSPRPIDEPHENENDGRVKELLFLEEEPPDSKNWSCEDVYDYFKKHLTEEAAQALLRKNIDGNALKLMGRREVLNLGFELGLSLKIFFHVRRLQLRTNNLMDIWNTNATNEDPTPASDSPRPIDKPHENENDGRVKELLFLEEEPPDSKNWSCEDVYNHFKKHLTEEAAQALLRKNIDGNALKSMGRREVFDLGLKVGPSLKIWFHVRRLQLRTNNLMETWHTTNEDPTPASDSPRPIDEPHENENDGRVKELLFLEEEPPDSKNWSCEDVYDYFKKHLTEEAAQALLRKNIDGNALKSMGRREVFNLGLKIGPSLKIWFHVRRLQLRTNNLMETWHTTNEDPIPASDSPRPIDEPHENENNGEVKKMLFLEEEPPDSNNWSCEDVYNHFKKHLTEEAAQALLRKNIDGNTLKSMGRREVFNLGLKIGPSLKIWFHVRRLQLRTNNLMETWHTTNEDPIPASDSPRPIDEPHENENNCEVKKLLFLEEEPPDSNNWSCEDVYNHFKKHLTEEAAQALLRKNIDGNALKLMGRREVLNLGFKLGLSLKILFHVRRLQLRTNNLMDIWNSNV